MQGACRGEGAPAPSFSSSVHFVSRDCGVLSMHRPLPWQGLWGSRPIYTILGLGSHAVKHAQTLGSLVAASGFFPLLCHLPSQELSREREN